MALSGAVLSVMAGRVPATHPRSVGPRRKWYNRQCAGGRDALGHDRMGMTILPQRHILMPTANDWPSRYGAADMSKTTAVGMTPGSQTIARASASSSVASSVEFLAPGCFGVA